LSAPAFLDLGEIDLWGIHVARCRALVRRALELLAADQLPPVVNEVALNRLLYWCILTAQRELGALGDAPPAPVIPEGHNAPAASDEERTERENKIPDFQWGLTDDQAIDVRESAKHFVVECKRVITPQRQDWIYTEQYVTAGVMRFVTRTHGYGMGVRDGAMVGYVQVLGFDHALNEIGMHLDAAGLEPLAEAFRDGETYMELGHSLVRDFEESPFELAHLWQRL
jgi:hypothetical protein